jgi:hypothetical protein
MRSFVFLVSVIFFHNRKITKRQKTLKFYFSFVTAVHLKYGPNPDPYSSKINAQEFIYWGEGGKYQPMSFGGKNIKSGIKKRKM